MKKLPQQFERDFFRALNSVVEPAVRRGLLSNRIAPSSLIVLESTGYLSGKSRRTPLLSNRIGRYRLISTVRGERSFWVKNLQAQPQVQYFIGGQERSSEALVIGPQFTSQALEELPAYLSPLTAALKKLAQRGWAFALLSPSDSKRV